MASDSMTICVSPYFSGLASDRVLIFDGDVGSGIQRSMSKLHPDSEAVDRVGADAIYEHFSITRQTLWLWRTAGVARQCRLPLALLGESLGHDMKDLRARYAARAPEASGAVPA